MSELELQHQMNVSIIFFLSQTEPKKVEEALQDADWVQVMQEELNEFERNKV